MLNQLYSMKVSFYPSSLMCVLLKGSDFTYKVRMVWIWWLILLHFLCLFFFHVRQSAWFLTCTLCVKWVGKLASIKLNPQNCKMFFCPLSPAAPLILTQMINVRRNWWNHGIILYWNNLNCIKGGNYGIIYLIWLLPKAFNFQNNNCFCCFKEVFNFLFCLKILICVLNV